jgi:hypothetical protein
MENDPVNRTRHFARPAAPMACGHLCLLGFGSEFHGAYPYSDTTAQSKELQSGIDI